MGGTGDWDIESYRSFYESDEHWALKREFMETHYHAFPEERVVCLAQVYANIELLGCRYPEDVMKEVSYLAKGIGMNYKEKKKTKLQRTFVKASDAAGAKVRGSHGQKRKNQNEHTSNEPLSKRKVSFVRAESSSDMSPPQNKMVPFVRSENEPEVGASNPIMSFIKAVRDDNPNADSNRDSSPQSPTAKPVSPDKCLSFIRSMRGDGESSDNSSIGSPKRGQQEKVDKYKKAIHQNSRQKITALPETDESPVGRGLGRGNFRSPRGRTANVGDRYRERGQYLAHLDALKRNNDPLCDFILVQRVYSNCDNPSIILDHSGTFSHMPVVYTYDQNSTRCHVTINDIHVASGRGECKKSAKDSAAVHALENLLERCFTLRILKLHSSQEEVSISEMSEEQNTAKFGSKHGSTVDTPIEDSSIGSKLLKMMGWGGGGLGKDGSGIAEPIKPAHVFGRSGLGHQEEGVTKDFRIKIKGLLQDYVRGSDMNDLAFSPLFSKEQRAEIHKMSRQMKLKSQSHGKGDNRFLVLSRKFSPKQLLYRLLQEGPTEKYQLIAPGETT